MRITVIALMFVSVAAAADDPRAVIEKAVNAQGGLDKLAQPATSFSRVKGSFHESMEFVGEIHSGGAGKLRLQLHFNELGSRTVILNGDKGWTHFDGITQDMNQEALARNIRARHVDRVCGLVSLLRDKGYTFSSLGESQVEGKAVVGVKVATEGKPDVLLYFDKATGLLSKSSFRGTEAGSDREVAMDAYYRDYQLFDNAAEAEKTLRATDRGVTKQVLLDYLRDNIPTKEQRNTIEALIARLGDSAFAVRQQASEALVKQGIKAGALLQKVRGHRDIEVSRRAAACLKTLEPECDIAAAVVRLVGLRKLADTEVLINYLPWAPNDSVAREVEDALFAIVRDATKPDPCWEKSLQHENQRVRQLAAAALGQDKTYLQRPGHRLFIDGIRLPRRSSTVVDGQKRLDLETIERTYFNGLEEKLFTPPVAQQN